MRDENEAIGTTSATPVGAHRAEVEEGRQDSAPPFGPLLFVPCLLLFVASLWLMGYAVDAQSGLLFALGILAGGVAFMVPFHLLRS